MLLILGTGPLNWVVIRIFRESCAIASGFLSGDNLETGVNIMSSTPDTSIRDKVAETIKTLPDGASWDDVVYRIYVRQKIENGLSIVREIIDGFPAPSP